MFKYQRYTSTSSILRTHLNYLSLQYLQKSIMFECRFRQLLITIFQFEEKIEAYRQLLNEQIQFNIKDLYIRICGNSSQATAYHLHLFLTQQAHLEESESIELNTIQSIIKSYNCCTSMNLSFIQFAYLFLSRQNKLLSKLTIERNSLGQIPGYLLNYVKKIIQLQIQLHKQLIQFRKSNSSTAEQWIRKNQVVSDDRPDEVYFDLQIIVQMCEEIQINSDILLRYLKVNDKDQIRLERMLSLFTLKNCHKISEIMKKSQTTKSTIGRGNPDPFIRPQFHDCLDRPKIIQNFSHREVRSIQKHLDRLNSKSKQTITEKIIRYQKHIEKQLIVACQYIKSILKLQEQIEGERVQLCLCTDFYPVLFFETFNKDKQQLLIPSSFQNYLEKLGLKVQTHQLYAVFKRYSNRIDGKLNFNEFCSIFDVCKTQYSHIQKNRLVKSLEDIQMETIKSFLRLVKVLVKNEQKIEKIKVRLQNEVDLRLIFSIFDSDQDGFISMTDLRVVWKKYLLMNIKQQDLMLLWYRLKAPRSASSLIKYEKFISELTPKSPWIDKKIRGKQRQKTLQSR